MYIYSSICEFLLFTIEFNAMYIYTCTVVRFVQGSSINVFSAKLLLHVDNVQRRLLIKLVKIRIRGKNIYENVLGIFF